MKKLTIIGGGPAGYAAALYATNFDIEVTLIESDTLGGTCLNRGCIPAKYWLHVAELNHEIDTSNEFGIEIKDKSINWQQTAQKRFDTVNKLVSGIGMLLKSKKVTVIEGWGSIKDKNTVNVKKLDGDELDISSDFILIATGSKPREIPNIKVDEKFIITSDTAPNCTCTNYANFFWWLEVDKIYLVALILDRLRTFGSDFVRCFELAAFGRLICMFFGKLCPFNHDLPRLFILRSNCPPASSGLAIQDAFGQSGNQGEFSLAAGGYAQ